MRRAKIEIAFPFTPICEARQTCSHKVEFSFIGQRRGTIYPDDGRPLKRELVNEPNE
jgi:hypothetical protein